MTAPPKIAKSVLELVGRRLGAGIVSLVNVFEPEVVVIGGGAIAGGELLLGPAREVVAGWDNERMVRGFRDAIDFATRSARPAAGDESGQGP